MFKDRFVYKNEVKEWNEDRWIDRIISRSKKIENIDKCRFESLKESRKEMYYRDTHTLYTLPLVVTNKDVYEKNNQYKGYEYAIDIFDGLYGHYPTENDIDEVLRLKAQVDNYVRNKEPYKINDKRVNDFYSKMDNKKDQYINIIDNYENKKIEELKEEKRKLEIGYEEINELDSKTLEAIDKHIQDLINGENISEEKAFTICKHISFIADKAYGEKYNNDKETVKELQTE